jgi:hypothetical protein
MISLDGTKRQAQANRAVRQRLPSCPRRALLYRPA